MYAQRFLPILLGLEAAYIIPFDYTLPVLLNPITQIKAGQELHYQLTNSRNVTCQATLSFSNDTFLPISTLAKPEACVGDQIAVFKIPYSVPNGAAGFEWQCSGIDATSFNLLSISGGSGDMEKLATDGNSTCLRMHCRSNSTTSQSDSSTISCL